MIDTYINKEYSDLMKLASDNANVYANANPFPHISFDNLLNPELLDKVLAEFPDLAKESAIQFNDSKQKKFAGKGEQSFGTETAKLMHFLNSEPFLHFLQKLTGMKEVLIGDPYFSGGGLHEIKRDGLLKLHVDFNKHGKIGLDRRINVLVYLNKNWKEEYGGHLELWDKDLKACGNKIAPIFNRVAIFSTTSFSYHGHPDPLKCPDDMSRKSLALYYFSNGRPSNEVVTTSRHSTIFGARDGHADDSKALQKDPYLKRKIKKIRKKMGLAKK